MARHRGNESCNNFNAIMAEWAINVRTDEQATSKSYQINSYLNTSFYNAKVPTGVSRYDTFRLLLFRELICVTIPAARDEADTNYDLRASCCAK